MRLNIHLYHHAAPVDPRVLDKLDLILAQLEINMDSLERIEAAAAKYDTLEASVAALITDLKAQVAEALANTKLSPDVEARLAAIFPHLEDNNDKLTAILTANTGATIPAPPPNPAPADPVSPASPQSTCDTAPSGA